MKIRLIAGLLALLAGACGDNNSADTLYVGDHIITMSEDGQTVTAVAVKDGTIIGTGTPETLAQLVNKRTDVVELGERALLPGFIDAHGHFSMQAFAIRNINIASPPVGPIKTFADIQQSITREIADKDLGPEEWIIARGYDDSLLAEGTHPDRKLLDEVAPENPVILFHVSGHMVVLNSSALEAVGIDETTPSPAGGEIVHYEGTSTPTGLLQESAMEAVYSNMPSGGILNSLKLLEETQNYYVSQGITTAQEGYMMPMIEKWLKLARLVRALKIDVVAFPGYGDYDEDDFLAMPFGEYKHHLKYGGAKLLLDGSPQGKTAFLSEPYHVAPHGKDEDYRGYTRMEQEPLDEALRMLYRNQIPVIAHANGDASSEQLVEAVEKAYAEFPGDHRTVMIHAQTVREDQLDRMKPLGMIPSYFSSHTFFWGDWHRDSVLGKERAYRISPAASTLARGMRFTVHNDAPIVPPDIMRLIWSTVTRQSRTGDIIGPDQRVDVMEALKAVTINAAYQIFEEDTKGSLEPGKYADLVILAEDPRTVDPDHLKDIEIVETIFRGETLFEK